MKFLITLFLLWISPCLLTAAQLTVTIQGLRNSLGVIVIGVYQNKESFSHPRSAFLYRNDIKIHDKKAVAVFQLKPGQYAISMFHDENRNKDFDLRFRTIPKEGWGFSNNAKPSPFWPDFEDAAFKISDDDRTLTIDAAYWQD